MNQIKGAQTFECVFLRYQQSVQIMTDDNN